MKLHLLIITMAILLALSGSAFAQSISLDHVDGLNGTGGLQMDTPIIFHVRLAAGPDAIAGMTVGHRIYSPDGVGWTTTTGTWVGVNTSMFDQIFITPFSDDGTGADTIGFSGFKMFMPGIPGGFDEIAYTIEIGPIASEYNGGTICLDSSWFPPQGIWKWVVNAQDVFPSWDGPHCFTVGEASPEITCPDNMEFNLCEPETLCFDFQSANAEWVTASEPAYIDGQQVCVPMTENGQTIVTLTAGAGELTTECSFTVDVTLDTPPVITVESQIDTVICDLQTEICIPLQVIDPEGNLVSLTSDLGSITPDGEMYSLCFAPPSEGSHTVTVTAMDGCGHIVWSMITFNITLGDPPSIDCPITYDNFLCGPGQASIPITIEPSDANVTVSPLGYYDPASGQIFFDVTETGLITFIITASNICGEATCEFSTFVHLGLPVVECPGVVDITVCEFGETCLTIPVSNLTGPNTNVQSSGGSVSYNGTEIAFCFQADSTGTYEYTVTTSNHCGDVVCNLTINVTQNCDLQPTTIEPDSINVVWAYRIIPMIFDIYLGNLTGDHTVADIDLASLVINGVVVPVTTEVILSHEGYAGEVVQMTIEAPDFIELYMPLYNIDTYEYTVSGLFADGAPFEETGQVILQGILVGDLNFDFSIDISDVVIMSGYIFQGGPAPMVLESGDMNHDGHIDISDIVGLVKIVFGPVQTTK